MGAFRGQGARYGTGTLILDSGELPHELGYPPLPLSHREIPHDSISPPRAPYAQARTCRVQQPTACTKGSWPPSRSHHHQPLPSFSKPPRGSQGNSQNIVKGATIGVRTLGPALGPSWQASLLLRWSLCDARSSPGSLLAIILWKVLTLGVFRFPAAPKVFHRLLVVTVGLPSIWAIATQPRALLPRRTVRLSA